MKLKVYLDSDDGKSHGHIKMSGAKLTTFVSSIVAAIVWLCQLN